MSRTRLLPVLLVAVLLLAACGSDDDADDSITLSDGEEHTEEDVEPAEEPDDEEPSPDDSEDETFEEASDEATAQGDAEGQWVTVFPVREVDGQLWVESEQRLLSEETTAVAGAAMEELFEGTTRDPGLAQPAGASVDVRDVALDGGVLVVDVSDSILDGALGAGAEEALHQAVAHTGTRFDSVDAVELRVGGEAITELWGHVDWSSPAQPDAFARAPVDVERPRYLETIDGSITVSGVSLTYESTVELDLIDPSGDVLEETFTTASQPAMDEHGPFSHTFDTEAGEAGEWTVRVREPDPSGGEGRAPYVADIVFKVE